MCSIKMRNAQLTLKLPTWGGKRRGAGRKSKGSRAKVSHVPRPVIRRRAPVQVTLRMRREGTGSGPSARTA